MQKIPAISITLTGQHLIEASAGTGKTWTLTGIVLRLLIEAKRPPEQIICTTFTRDATAEMRERILARLHDFYQLLLWLEKIGQNNVTHSWLYTDETDEKKQAKFAEKRELQLTKLAKNAGYQEIFSDPINLYLINYLFDNYQDYPLSMAIRRTQLLQISMDKLFVGTLDSLAQKWLNEYSAETGYQQGMAISNIEDEMITDIIHDEIRQYHARLYHQKPILYQLLQQSNKLTDIDNHKKSVQKAMQFISAPVDEVKIENFDLLTYQKLIDEIILQKNEVEEFFIETGGYFNSIKGQLKNNAHYWWKSIDILENLGLSAYSTLQKDNIGKKLIEAIPKTDNIGSQFYAKEKDKNYIFNELSVIKKFKKFIELSEKLKDYTEQVINQLNFDIIQAVRQRLPQQLEENNQTTFSLQMVRLNQALTGRQGQTLARYIRHHYPIALIDESQDINGEQAKMLSSIYLNKNKDSSEKNGFLLLVGDPKQAIYGFRGGDVANYNMMKINFKNPLSLTVNRRSNARLINGLNQWFGANETNGENDFAKLGEGIYYQHIQAHNKNSKLSWHSQKEDNLYLGKTGVGVLHIPVEDKNSDDDFDKYQIVAKHIQAILQPNETLDGKAITASDIVVLARKNQPLQKTQWALEKLAIPTVKKAEISIFSSQMATDLLAILQAIENPFYTGFVNRALTTHWYGLNLQEVKNLASRDNFQNENEFSYYDFQRHLQMAQQQWEDWGVMSAIQLLLKENPFAQNKQSVWEHLAEYSLAERYLLDLRQLLDLLAQHSRGKGAMEILDWFSTQVSKQPKDEDYLQHAIPTEAGVQLMTIHKSKGLEFPIVYVLGMDNTVKKNETTPYIFPYLRSNERRLSVVKDDKNKDYQLLVNNESLEEEKRIYYVALTRASEQVFVVVQDHAKNATLDYRPSILWLECDNKEKKYNLPNRLQNKVDWITSEQILQVVEGLEQQPIKQPQQAEKKEDSRGLIGYKNYDEVIEQKYFKGWRKTSFTALSYQLDKHSEDMAIAEPDYMFDEEAFANNILMEKIETDDIRFNFVGGAVAGTFLHKILEKINFDNPQHWSEKIDKGIREYGLPVSYASSRYQGLPTDDNLNDNPQHQALKNWLSDILQSPLQSSKVKLSELPANQRKAELGFDLGLGDDFKIEKINEVFAKYLDIEGADKDKLLRLSENRSPHYYRYLRGEIDLVYQHGGKYYVVDYKSNYLGDNLNNYNQIGLRKAMSHAGYWLQAVIYQVALHRLLKLRVADYQGNEKQYLGAVEYVFLRGCLADDSEYGKISWDIPIELVKEMDRVFGLD